MIKFVVAFIKPLNNIDFKNNKKYISVIQYPTEINGGKK